MASRVEAPIAVILTCKAARLGIQCLANRTDAWKEAEPCRWKRQLAVAQLPVLLEQRTTAPARRSTHPGWWPLSNPGRRPRNSPESYTLLIPSEIFPASVD